MLSIGLMIAGCHRKPSHSIRIESSDTKADVRIPREAWLRRPIFPYSIVPGGVRSKAELEAAIRFDPVVARHYAGVDLEALKPIRLERSLSAYVSFRQNGNVYWTSRKISLTAGETVFMAGNRGVRGRCGNQISESPQRPVLQDRKLEPTSEILATPELRTAEAPAKAAEESARNAVPARLPFDLAKEEHAAPISLPSQNLGWSTPVWGGSPPAGIGAAGGGAGGGTGGGGGGGPIGSGSPVVPYVPGNPVFPVVPAGYPIIPAAPVLIGTIFPVQISTGPPAVISYSPSTTPPASIPPAPLLILVQYPPGVGTYFPVPPGVTPVSPQPPAQVPPVVTPPTSPVPVTPVYVPTPLIPPPVTDMPEPATWLTFLAGALFLVTKRLRS